MRNIITNGKKLLVVLMFSGLTFGGFAQTDPPPPPGGGGSTNTNNATNQLGGAAHIGGGVLILLTLALGYAGKRFYDLRKKAEA
ncbi:MAG: hypothetical protein GXO86_10635 [Chlorobi bacterium]|nr:hypothetical protein [Chlorobiota bacterium]